MRRAITLAEKAKGYTHPNPSVGAVVVKKGTIIAEGATQRCGGPHAEAVALAKAGSRARGSVLYVTLEPCCHYGRTPPCTDSIIASGVRKVFVACVDPNPLVNGKGIRALQRHGIEVTTGMLHDEARRINEDFFWAIRRHTPWITVKLALTLDGRIADSRGRSRWITNTKARLFVHQLRRKHAAIAVGKGTLLADNPRLTVRNGDQGAAPARIVFASNPSVGQNTCFRKTAKTCRSIVVCPGGMKKQKELADDGTLIWHTGAREIRPHLRAFAAMAYDEGLISIMVEGGQKLASSLLEAGMVNRLYLFYGNRLLGGGIHGILFRQPLSLKGAIALHQPELIDFQGSFAVTGTLNRKE